MPSRKHRSRRHKSRSRTGSKSRSRSHSRLGAKSRSHSKKVYAPRGMSQGHAKRAVYDGVYQKTRGGLTRSDLIENKYGKVVSKRKHAAGKSLQRKNPYKQNPGFLKNKGKIEKIANRRR